MLPSVARSRPYDNEGRVAMLEEAKDDVVGRNDEFRFDFKKEAVALSARKSPSPMPRLPRRFMPWAMSKVGMDGMFKIAGF